MINAGQPFRADLPRLGRCTKQMLGLSNEVVSMFDDFEAGVRLFSPWTGDGTDQSSIQFQQDWHQRNTDIGEIALSYQQAVDGMVDGTFTSMRGIKGTSEFAQDEIRDHRSRTEGVMDDTDSDSGSRH
ncbi:MULTISPECIES: hypothetical protein [Streptomyces]|uniref:WXG100 family type VII secretion target n=2 Tax=Streptomyces TaxID=1883 RepID=A0ABV9J802_9ACTN